MYSNETDFPVVTTEIDESNGMSPGKLVLLSKFLVLVLISNLRKLRAENAELRAKVKGLQQQVVFGTRVKRTNTKSYEQKISCENTLLTDGDVLFNTGIESKKMFDDLYKHVSQYVQRRWRGAKNVCTKAKKYKPPENFATRRKLSGKDEFLLTLMRVRLGLVQRHVAHIFGVSSALASGIFNAWLTAMDKVLAKPLVFWPSKEQTVATMPPRYRSVKGLRTIIDCSEIFIETPKDPKLQASTWSDYKHHNTAKFLIACAPNSMITFISDIYGGRASDKAITNDSEFLDLCEWCDVIMADKGFNIRDECAARNIELYLPPGKKGQAQMTSADVAKTKKIANLRIIIEQVIQRLKTFRILKNVVPISLLPNLPKMVRVCGALCNLKEPIYKT